MGKNGNPFTYCHIWIEFETFNVRERNALKQLTELYVQQNHTLSSFLSKMIIDQLIGSHAAILTARSPVFAANVIHVTPSFTGNYS